MEYSAAVYLTAVLDYVSADTLKLAGNYAEHCKADKIKVSDVQIAISADQVLQALFLPLTLSPSVLAVQ